MTTVSKLFRISCIVFLAVVTGCVASRGKSLKYIGHTNGIEDAPTPSGFEVSPHEARHIIGLHRQNLRDSGHDIGIKKTVDDYYHDGKNYYICDGFNGSKASTALKRGTIINGRSGEIYDRKSKVWKPDARTKKEERTN